MAKKQEQNLANRKAAEKYLETLNAQQLKALIWWLCDQDQFNEIARIYYEKEGINSNGLT